MYLCGLATGLVGLPKTLGPLLGGLGGCLLVSVSLIITRTGSGGGGGVEILIVVNGDVVALVGTTKVYNTIKS